MDADSWGDYTVVKKLGEGGMAVVYLAHPNDVPNHRVVLKELKDARHGERFKGEARNLARLKDHPNICHLYHFFPRGSRTVLVTEYIDGATLDEIARLDSRLDMATVCKVGVDVLDVLEFAHERRIFHRDLKPTNIMVDVEGKIKVIDFGIAKFEDDPDQTIPGAFLGTPQFAPPEQFSHDEKTNWGQCDIYALGMTLYFCLTGRLPFEKTSAREIAEAKRITDAPAPSRFNKDIPRELDRIILKALARLPEERYATATEMKSDLLAVRNSMMIPQTTLLDTVEWIMERRVDQPLEHPEKVEGKPGRRRLETRQWVLIVTAAAAIAFLLIFDPAGWFGPQTAGQLKKPSSTIALLADEPIRLLVDDSLVLAATLSTYVPWDTGHHIVTMISHSAPVDTFREDVILAAAETLAVRFKREKYSSDFYPTAPLKDSTGAKTISDRKAISFAFTVDTNVDVYWDDTLKGKSLTSASIKSAPGRHVLELRDSDSPDRRFVDTIELGGLESLHRKYQSLFQPEVGELRVGSTPIGGVVRIDGVVQSDRTPYTFTLPAGPHTIGIADETRGLVRETTLTVEPGQIARYFVDF